LGRDVSIELTFESPITVDAILGRLGEAGWGPASGGQIGYMAGDHDWYWVDQSEYGRVRAEMNECVTDGRSTAVSLWYPEGHGTNVLFLPSMDTLIISLDLNRRPLAEAPELTDLAWYLQRLVPPLAGLGLLAVIAHDAYEE
jgi:hypothetical protein